MIRIQLKRTLNKPILMMCLVSEYTPGGDKIQYKGQLFLSSGQYFTMKHSPKLRNK